MSKCLELIGIVFGVIGTITAIIASAQPMWKVKVVVETNEFDVQEGPWIICNSQSTEQMQCQSSDSLLAPTPPQDLHVAKRMTVISIILAILGVQISIVGAKRMKRGAARAKLMMIAGIFFILSGILFFIPVCWIAHNIIQDLYNAQVSSQMRLGKSLYIGWASAALFLIGGALLCSRCSSEERYKPPQMVYTKADGEHNNV